MLRDGFLSHVFIESHLVFNHRSTVCLFRYYFVLLWFDFELTINSILVSSSWSESVAYKILYGHLIWRVIHRLNHIKSTNEWVKWSLQTLLEIAEKHTHNNSNNIRYEHIFKMELNEREPAVYFTYGLGETKIYTIKPNWTKENRATENGSVSE